MAQSPTSDLTNRAPPPSPRQVALGLFILFQLAFLLVSNLLGFIRWGIPESTEKPRQLFNRLAPDFAEQRGHGWRWTEELDGNLRHWMELTGQEQDWSLFAPGVGKGTGFPAVLMLWDDPPPDGPSLKSTMLAFDEANGFNLCAPWNPASPHQAQLALPLPRAEFLLSENEPKDIDNFVRFGRPRFRRFESRFYVHAWPEENESAEKLAVRMTERMRDLVRSDDQAIAAYLRYRMEAWLREHPGEKRPKQVVLLERFYSIRAPEEPRGWDGPTLVPCARWWPDPPRDDRYYVAEPFDFAAQRFHRLSR